MRRNFPDFPVLSFDMKILYEKIIPACSNWSKVILDGQVLKITDIHGSQAVDFLCFADEDRQERYNAPNTLKAAGTIALTKGHHLYSDLARPLFTIIEDTFIGHDTIGGCCSTHSNKMLYDVDGVTGCRENFLNALAEHGMGRRDIVPNVNFFMEFPVSEDDGGAISTGRSIAGDFVSLKANLNVLAVISNCPQINNPCNAFNPTAIKVEVLAGYGCSPGPSNQT